MALALSVWGTLALPVWGADVDRPGRAQDLQRHGDLEHARQAYLDNLTAAKAAANNFVAGQSLLGLAQIDLVQGHYAQSLSEATEAEARFARRQQRDSASLREEAHALTTAGQARYYSGDSQGALHDFEASLKLTREGGDREAEVTALNNAGSVYIALGRYGDAFRQFQDAGARLAGMEGEPWFLSRQQLTNANLAVLYQGWGICLRAAEIYRAMASHPKALPASEEAQALANMGTLYRRLGDPVLALEKYRAAQAVYRMAALTSGELSVLNNIGIDYALDLGDYHGAIEAFTQALALGEKSGAKRAMMTSLLYRGEAQLRAGKTDEAQMDFEGSKRLAADLRADEEKWHADYGLARVSDAEGDRKRSDELLGESIAVIEKMRTGSAGGPGRTGFLIERRDVYDLLIQHKASGEGPDAAAILELMERSRSRELQDQRGAARSDHGWRARAPADTVVIEYWMGPRAVAAIAVSAEGTRIYYKDLSDADAAALGDLPEILADAHNGDWIGRARACSRVLLDDISELKRPGLRHIAIVPDGLLARIPFEALPFGDGLLIDRAAVSYLPFASAYEGEVAAGNRLREWAPPWKRTLLAFANPARRDGGVGLDLNGEGGANIPQAGKEVNDAARQIGGRSEVYLGAAALKKPLFEARPGSFSVIHFATHAFADLSDANRSYILFSGEKPGFDYLFLREAKQLGVAKGALVTVSACDSGSGQIERGEGVQSFASGFLAAGARAVVTSLWRIGDAPSAELMSRFYAGMARGEGAGEALRNAKLAIRRSTASAAHPPYWAAFTLTGDAGMTLPRVIPWTLLYGGVLLTLALFGLVRMREGRA